MGIISRFKDIMEANFNAILDKLEDPEKMIDQYLRDLQNDFAEVKAETASVMADEKAAKRKLDECDEEIRKMAEYARRAVAAGNDDEARQFLAKKAQLTERRAGLDQNYTLCCENTMKMRQMHDKLEQDISMLKNKQDVLKAKVKVAKTQEKINQMSSASDRAGATMSAFARMEEKVDKMVDQADAMAELNASGSVDKTAELAKKYDQEGMSADVDAELAALKAEMGV
ncbi:MAG: PspA/IM30 family protein [Lachnospiraceae bacterium]|nr:PspA/IM30 family protein [Lachnospiraceae bacterium]